MAPRRRELWGLSPPWTREIFGFQGGFPAPTTAEPPRPRKENFLKPPVQISDYVPAPPPPHMQMAMVISKL